MKILISVFTFVAVVQLLSPVWLFVTPWTAACQISLSFTISWNPLKLMSIELVMPSNHLILHRPLSSCLQSFPASGSFLKSWFSASGGQSIGASVAASALSINIQGWFPLGLTGLISLLFKGLSRILSNTTVHMVQLSHPYMSAGKTIALTQQTFVGKTMSLLFNMLSLSIYLCVSIYL